MKTNGNSVPAAIRPDIVKQGAVRINCAWDITEKEVEDEEGQPRVSYDYESGVIWWALPDPSYIARENGKQILTEAGKAYLQSMSDEILKWVQTSCL